MSAFYIADGETFTPTLWTRGPWSPDAQHAGPVAALAGRALELAAPSPLRVSSFRLEIFRPISAVLPMRIATEVVRDGAKVRYVTASVRSGDDEVARAAAWCLRARDGEAAEVNREAVPYPSPAQTEVFDMAARWPGAPYFNKEEAYGTAMELRFVRGTFFEPGPAAAWMRPTIDLVEGEEISPLQRVLAAADSGNGISMQLDVTRSIFVNVDLHVALIAPPAGEWICLDARTRVDPAGIGLAESIIWDEARLIGRGAQCLFVGAP